MTGRSSPPRRSSPDTKASASSKRSARASPTGSSANVSPCLARLRLRSAAATASTGWETLCESQQNTGYSIDGGFAEYAVADADYVVPVPEGVTRWTPRR